MKPALNEKDAYTVARLAELEIPQQIKNDQSPLVSSDIKRAVFLLMVAIVVIGSVVFFFYPNESGAAKSSVEEVLPYEKAEKNNAPAPNNPPLKSHMGLEVSGVVIAERQAALSSKLMGVVSEVLITDGMKVKKGDPLVILDQEDQQTQMRVSAVQLRLAKLSLGEAENELLRAESDQVRKKGIGEKYISNAELAELEFMVKGLKLARDRAQQQVELQIQQNSAAELNLEYTVIRAPFDGVVAEVSVQAGEVVTPLSAVGAAARSGIGVLIDPTSLVVEVEVPELYLSRVREGQKVKISPDAYPDIKLLGEVNRIGTILNRGASSVNIKIKFEEHSDKLKPEMAVSVSWLDANEGFTGDFAQKH